MKNFKLLIFAFLFLLGGNISAQVNGINYQLKYDTVNCQYDALLIINSGSATSISERVQFNAQYSVVVPTGTAVAVTQSYMPLVGNEAYTGSVPLDWSLTSTVTNPASLPGFDFHAMVPNIDITSHYNNVSAGDTIKLFSLSTAPIVNCGDEIRMFRNPILPNGNPNPDGDPSSSDVGMNSSDFSNGFTMGSPNQLYQGNSTELHPPKPFIASLVNACGAGLEIDLTATTSVCQGPLTYSWEGPDGFNSTDEDVNIQTSDPAKNGTYTVTITDNFGCETIESIEATSKPNAGPDTLMCAGESIILSGTSPTTGTWAHADENTFKGFVTLSPLAGGQVQLNANNLANQSYDFVYSIPGCSDTTTVVVNPKPQVVIQDLDAQICAFETVQLAALPAGGTWVSNNLSVATIDANTGLATGVGAGTATFTYTAPGTSCSTISATLTVNPPPVVTLALDTICVNTGTVATPTTGGTWVSSDPSIATIGDDGQIDGLTPGSVELRYTDDVTGCTSDTLFLEVIPVPVVVFNGNDSLCVGGFTYLEPSTGGTWTSSNPAVASISNSGVVQGIIPGTVTFTYTHLSSGCVSEESPTVWVLDAPTVAVDGDDKICIGETSTATSNGVTGTWVSNDTLIATIDSISGVITATGFGQTTFTFTETATGCTSETGALIVDSPPTVNTNFSDICIGQEATLTPSTGGTWSALNTGIATLSNGNTVTGVASGTAGFIFNSDATGCDSDTLFVTVTPGEDVESPADAAICIGETTTIGSNGVAGTWSSSDETVATIDNFGVVTGVGAGLAEFTFTDSATQCESDPSDPVFVNPAPILALSDNAICLEETASATTSAFSGTWTSDDTGVATINAFTGAISPVAPGSTFFTFVDNNGCSAQTGLLVVNETPIVEFPVTDEICVNETTNVSPTTGGTWSSSDETVATVGPTGVVTGIGAGTAELTFVETLTGCSSASLTVTVNGSVDVSIDGDDELCIGETTNLLPNSGGTWSSNNDAIATVTPGGLVTAVSSGSTTFIFTSDAGQCTSSNSPPVIVNPNPTITFDDFEVCVGETAQASTATTGTWTSTNPAVASIDPVTGLITGVSIGTTTFTFQDGTTTCVSPVSALFTVAEPEDVSINNTQICVGEETNVFPSTNGTWESSDPSIATVTNEGLVQGVSPGKVVFRFTQNAGCTSAPTDSLEVTPGPDTDIGPDNQLCIDDQIQILPASGGTWTSSNTDVATITDGGLVTAVGAGTATFTFESSSTGCQSVPSDPITVDAPVTTVITGSTTICINGMTQLTPSSGGTWASTNESVATIDDTGLVTGVSSGTATFIFTPDNTGCPSNESDPVSVSLSPDAEITGLTDICIGAFTTLSPTAGGTWTSSDPSVASVTDNGVVTALASGVVSFTFNETATGCDSEASTGDLTISNCINPDFNATFVDIPVDGNVETNDNTPVGTTYGPTPVYTGGPAGAVFSISVNSDGTYTFQTNTVGVYTWNVPVCIPTIDGPLTSGCQVSELVITVVDFLEPDLRPIANVDIATTPINTAVEINSLANDKCVVIGGCELDPNITVVSGPSNGMVTVDALTGNTTYTPNNNFVGHDTLRYSVCVDGDAANCAEANQIITILSPTANNTTVAADDFNSGAQDTPITGNVSDNDYDPEGDNQTVTPQTTTNAAGTLVLLADGSYEFTPTETFYGPVDFPYTTCDDNVNVACTDATLHILVVRDIYIQLRVYLEGAFINNLNEVGTTHERPLMRDDLRKSSFTGARYIPDEEPYASEILKAEYWEVKDNPSIYDPFTIMNYDYTLMEDKFKIIPEPSTIFGVEGEDAVVDWISVELRSKDDNTLVVASRSALVQRDGDVIDLNGESGVRFKGLEVDDYYVVVRHRLHLGAMTAVAKTPEQYADLVDFTDDATGFFDFGTSKGIQVNGVTIDFAGLSQATLAGNALSNKTGYRALWAGDLDKNGRIKFTQPDDDLNLILNGVFLYEIVPGVEYNFYTNFDFAFGYQAGDYDMNSKTKFDNPNDDKNYLFGQVLFYPLNNEFRSNFDFFVEQIPENVPTK